MPVTLFLLMRETRSSVGKIITRPVFVDVGEMEQEKNSGHGRG